MYIVTSETCESICELKPVWQLSFFFVCKDPVSLLYLNFIIYLVYCLKWFTSLHTWVYIEMDFVCLFVDRLFTAPAWAGMRMEAPCSVVIPMELSEFGVLAATSDHTSLWLFIYYFCFFQQTHKHPEILQECLFLCQSILGLDLLYCLWYLCGFKLFHFCWPKKKLFHFLSMWILW